MLRLPSVTISFVFIKKCVSDENLPNDERRKSTNAGSYFDFNIRNIWDYITSSGTYLTNLLTPWSRVLLEKLTGSAASQEIPRIFGTRRFITVLTSARHLSLS